MAWHYVREVCNVTLQWFDPGSVHVGFVVDKVELGQVFSECFGFTPVNFIPPVLHYFGKMKKKN
jgi:hypothetical protein